MDFFANAFVTRDVAAKDNDQDDDDVVVKDGIQIREKAISSAVDVVKCEVCGLVNAKYKCPGCFCQTCSLQCSKQHKLDTTCSGVRSRTHFVERKQYSEQDMMSDYNFLEEVGRTVDNAARENVKRQSGHYPNRKHTFGANNTNNTNNKRGRNQQNKNNQQDPVAEEEEGEAGISSVTKISLSAAQELERQGSEGSGSYKDKQLIMHVRKRGAHLMRMADGLKKRKENNTHWRDKPSRILWTIEWLFPEMNTSRRVLEHKNEELKTLKELLAEALSRDENNKELAEKYPTDVLDQCRLYFVIPLRHANQPALYPLKNMDSLQDALKFKKVLEYPTILVLGPGSTTTSSAGTTSFGSVPSSADTTTTETTSAAVVANSASAEAESNAEPGQISEVTGASSAAKPSSPSENTSTETVAQPLDHTHPILTKYTIEEPPTQWPRRPDQQQNRQNNNRKRPNDTTEEEEETKKVKLDDEAADMEEDGEEAVKEEEKSSDDDSDDSDDSDSDSDESSSEEENDVASQAAENKREKEEGGETEDAIMATTATAEEALEANEHANLAIGQAIMDAFNQDFGQAE